MTVSAEERPQKTLRRTEAFNATRDIRATMTKSEHNERESWLARLPLEIRRCIWRYVLGDQILHIQIHQVRRDRDRFDLLNYDSDSEENHQWRVKVCDNEKSFQELCELSKPSQDCEVPGEKAPEFLESLSEKQKNRWWQDKRSNLLCHIECTHSWTALQDPRWSLNLLRTCRTVYHEANLVLWTTNTFSFRDAKSFAAFIRCRTPLQLQHIAKLHVVFKGFIDSSLLRAWEKVLSINVIKKLKGLRAIHVYMKKDSLCEELLLEDPLEKREAIEFLRNLKILPLRESTIIVDSRASVGIRPKNALAHSECLAFAEQIRNEILDPNGAIVWQTEHDKEVALKAQCGTHKLEETGSSKESGDNLHVSHG